MTETGSSSLPSLTVACVLRSGGDYRPEHVARLRADVARHLTKPHRFVCLTDRDDLGCETIRLKHDWPGWFSKLELFDRERLPGQVLYFDLDTLIVGPLDGVACYHRFTVLRNFWVGRGHPRIGSGVMAWGVDLSPIYRSFAADAEALMQRATYPRRADFWGDQGVIQEFTPVKPLRWQEVCPGRFVSYKMHCQSGVPSTASVVCFHGKPRPWHTPLWGSQ